VERHLKELAKYDEFIHECSLRATLTALAKEPATADVVIARPFLKDDLAHAAALRIVSSKGTALDVNDLIEIARTNYGAERKVALEGVQRLAADRLDTAKTLLALEGWEMHRAALSLVPSLSDQTRSLSYRNFSRTKAQTSGSSRSGSFAPGATTSNWWTSFASTPISERTSTMLLLGLIG